MEYEEKEIFMFMNLPAELANDILLLACKSRSLQRALRLRLVCKSFQDTVPRIILQTTLLDDWCMGHNIANHRQHLPHGFFQSIWNAFLFKRLRSPAACSLSPPVSQNPTPGSIFPILSQAIQAYAKAAGLTSPADIDRISEKAADIKLLAPSIRIFPRVAPTPASVALSLAAFFGDMQTATVLLAGGARADVGCSIKSASEAAGITSNLRMLELFIRSSGDNRETTLRRHANEALVMGHGSTELVDFLLSPKPGRIPLVDTFAVALDVPVWEGMRAYRMAHYQKFDSKLSLADPWIHDPATFCHHLIASSTNGQLDLVQHILKIGNPLAAENDAAHLAVERAARGCHVPTLQVLLNAGLGPNGALQGSAAGGCISIVRAVLQQADSLRAKQEEAGSISPPTEPWNGFHEELHKALDSASILEHREMHQLLATTSSRYGYMDSSCSRCENSLYKTISLGYQQWIHRY